VVLLLLVLEIGQLHAAVDGTVVHVLVLQEYVDIMVHAIGQVVVPIQIQALIVIMVL